VRVAPHGNGPTLSGRVARPLLRSVTIVTKYISHVHIITLAAAAAADDDDDVVLCTVSCPAVNATDTSTVDGEWTTDVVSYLRCLCLRAISLSNALQVQSTSVTPLNRKNDALCPLYEEEQETSLEDVALQWIDH